MILSLGNIDHKQKGAENGTRTRDPNLGKVVLYQLSYFRINFYSQKCISLDCGCKGTTFFRTAKTFRHFFQKKSSLRLFGFSLPYPTPYLYITRSEERGGRSEERGGRSEERGARNEERGARNEERGMRSGVRV